MVYYTPRTGWSASANALFGGGQFLPSHAIDEDVSTFFHPKDQNIDYRSNWLQIDFGQELFVNQVELTFRNRPETGFRVRRSFVEVWNKRSRIFHE